MVLSDGMVGSSLRFATEWDKGRMGDSLWDLGNYSISWCLLFLSHPVAIAIFLTWFAWKVDTATVPFKMEKTVEPTGILSDTGPPCESGNNICMAYRVQILRDKYRSLPDSRRSSITNMSMNLRELDIAAQIIGGVDVSFSLPTAPLFPRHQDAYASHVSPHTCSSLIV